MTRMPSLDRYMATPPPGFSRGVAPRRGRAYRQLPDVTTPICGICGLGRARRFAENAHSSGERNFLPPSALHIDDANRYLVCGLRAAKSRENRRQCDRLGPVDPDVQIGSRRQTVHRADSGQGLVGKRRHPQSSSAQAGRAHPRSNTGPTLAWVAEAAGVEACSSESLPRTWIQGGNRIASRKRVKSRVPSPASIPSKRNGSSAD